jgi:diguanylate cyclase (GGDEF)-like protein
MRRSSLAKKSDMALRAVARDGVAANEHEHDHEAAWQLIHDDLFDRASTDQELEDIVERLSAKTAKPYSEVIQRMLGMEGMAESAARGLFRRILGHRADMAKALGRPVHVRVAGLDLLTMRSSTRHESRAILVSPALLERALEEAGSDAVTGLPQRAHFMSLLRHELRQRKRRNIAVVYLDLDRMKRVNDEHGHARGDEVLRLLSRAARVTLRHGDVLARIGGDEFALILLDASQAEAEAAVRRLRARFEAKTAPLGVSFSAGIALATEGEGAEELLARADVGMYREKRERAERAHGAPGSR